MLKVLGIIPARFASTRFPGKPLVSIYGKSMIQRVYEQALQSKILHKVIVATDDDKIFTEVENFGGNVEMTSSKHKNGTERCAEVLSKTNEKFDVIINIQGDEPFFEPRILEQLSQCFINEKTEIATLIKRIESITDLDNQTVVKAVITEENQALYFSRFPIPYHRNTSLENRLKTHKYYKHIGIYAYRPEILQKIVLLKESKLEKAESLEQLRWLENGFNIGVSETEHDSNSVDTPEDLDALMEKFKGDYFD
ncbi:MAG: 3-deoxy-manno-octulosonate cytidylyltransferase [Chitinophagales bacterium]